MSKLSERLAEEKRRSGLSNREIVSRAKDFGYALSNYTVSAYTGPNHPVPASRTLEAFSRVFNVSVDELRQLAGAPAYQEPFEPDELANSLTRQQRSAVNQIIRLLAEGNSGTEQPSNVVNMRRVEPFDDEWSSEKSLESTYAADKGDENIGPEDLPNEP